MDIITIRDRITATAAHLEAAGCDWTHDLPGTGPYGHRDTCDCDGRGGDSCQYGREAAEAMADVAETLRDAAQAIDEGDMEGARVLVQRARDMEREWGDDPACLPLMNAVERIA